MRTKRGTTLIETIFTLSLASTILAAVATLASYVLIRTGDSVTQFNTINDSQEVLDAIALTATEAISCTNVTVGSITAIKCTMPANGSDLDGDGILETYLPNKVYKTLQETHTNGKRIWYFASPWPVSVGASGRYWYRAIKSSDSTPSLADIDSNWAMSPKYVAGVLTATHDSAKQSTSLSITTDPSISAPSGYVGTKSIPIPSLTLGRTVRWHNTR